MARKASSVATGCLWFLLPTICGSTAWSQEAQPPNAPAVAQAGGDVSARLHEIFFREMSAYNFFLEAEKQKKLIMRREPVLRYPASPTEYCGEIYVWTERGRAAVIGCVFAGEAENATYRLFHEFHSLATKPLVTVGGDTRWQPEEAGIEFKLVPDKAEPHKNKARRLTEMWRISTSSPGIFDGVITKRYGVFIAKEIPREAGRK